MVAGEPHQVGHRHPGERAAVGNLLRVVQEREVGIVRDALPGLVDSGAELHVLRRVEDPLVEQPDGVQQVPSEEPARRNRGIHEGALLEWERRIEVRPRDGAAQHDGRDLPQLVTDAGNRLTECWTLPSGSNRRGAISPSDVSASSRRRTGPSEPDRNSVSESMTPITRPLTCLRARFLGYVVPRLVSRLISVSGIRPSFLTAVTSATVPSADRCRRRESRRRGDPTRSGSRSIRGTAGHRPANSTSASRMRCHTSCPRPYPRQPNVSRA